MTKNEEVIQSINVDHSTNPLEYNEETGYTILDPEDVLIFIQNGWRINSRNLRILSN